MFSNLILIFPFQTLANGQEPKRLKIDVQDGFIEKDRAYKNWEDKINKFNDKQIEDARLVFPTWYITSRKIVQVEHILESGETIVSMETIPSKKDAARLRLKLDLAEWVQLRSKASLINDFIDAVEGKGLKKVDEVLTCWKIEKYKDSNYCRVPVCTGIRITFAWKDDETHCSIDIRRGRDDIIDAEGKYWKSSDSGMYLTAPSCKYFLKLIVKICIGLKIFQNIHYRVYDLYMCLLSYPMENARKVKNKPLEDHTNTPPPDTTY